MKLTNFLYEITRCNELELPSDLGKEDFPFPVSEEEYQEYIKQAWDCKIHNELFPKYCKENNLDIKASEVVDYDIDKSYETTEIIFSFKDKYYRYYYVSVYWGSDCDFLYDNKELEEVEPYTETITITKWRCK